MRRKATRKNPHAAALGRLGGLKGGRARANALTAEQRRYDAALSTTFLVTQAQRDLLQAQVNLLQTTLDYESSLVNFETVRQAPRIAAGDVLALRGDAVVLLPTASPRGVFRPGAGAGF